MDDIDGIESFETVTSHLTGQEADSIKSMLTSMNIDFIASGHDAKSRYDSLYYQIKVKKRDFKVAKQIIDKRRAKLFLESRKCPKCKTLGYKEIEKRAIWEKIYYYGTTLVECKKCKTRFSI